MKSTGSEIILGAGAFFVTFPYITEKQSVDCIYLRQD